MFVEINRMLVLISWKVCRHAGQMLGSLWKKELQIKFKLSDHTKLSDLIIAVNIGVLFCAAETDIKLFKNFK